MVRRLKATLQAVGLDIDGTITADPDFFAGLTRDLLAVGCQVHIVSSRSPEGLNGTQKELAEYGVQYSRLYLLPPISVAQELAPHVSLDWYQKHQWQKVRYSLEQGITHFADDETKVLSLFKRFAPDIVAVPFENRRILVDLIIPISSRQNPSAMGSMFP